MKTYSQAGGSAIVLGLSAAEIGIAFHLILHPSALNGAYIIMLVLLATAIATLISVSKLPNPLKVVIFATTILPLFGLFMQQDIFHSRTTGSEIASAVTRAAPTAQVSETASAGQSSSSAAIDLKGHTTEDQTVARAMFADLDASLQTIASPGIVVSGYVRSNGAERDSRTEITWSLRRGEETAWCGTTSMARLDVDKAVSRLSARVAQAVRLSLANPLTCA